MPAQYAYPVSSDTVMLVANAWRRVESWPGVSAPTRRRNRTGEVSCCGLGVPVAMAARTGRSSRYRAAASAQHTMELPTLLQRP